MKIREAAQKVGVHENTIRNLERLGLIHPRRTLTGHRIFDEEILAKIKEIYTKNSGDGEK